MERASKYTLNEVAGMLTWPRPDANKYTRGTLHAVVGCERYPGAACLAATAAQRAGAGYVEVMCAPEAVAQVRAASPSLVVGSWEALATYAQRGEWREDDVRDGVRVRSADAAGPLGFGPSEARLARTFPSAPSSRHPLAYLVGCGFDPDAPESEALAHATLALAQAPVVVDGGGLASLASPEGRLVLRRRFVEGLPTVVTPHAGEAARLAAPLKLPCDDPVRLARLISLAYGVVAMVKGPVTYVSDGERTVRMDGGTPALAKAGTGDVLAGMTGALLAQGLNALDACVLAATLHAHAARAAAKKLTDICVTAEDVVAYLPEGVKALAKNA